MKTQSTNKPETLTHVGNYYLYAYNIIEYPIEDTCSTDNEEPSILYDYREVKIYEPISADKITKAVINDAFGSDIESKMINDYNAALLGVLDESYIDKYKKFLSDRRVLKNQVDRDCLTYNIGKR